MLFPGKSPSGCISLLLLMQVCDELEEMMAPGGKIVSLRIPDPPGSRANHFHISFVDQGGFPLM